MTLAVNGKPGQVILAVMDESVDPAAVFAAAISLYHACIKAAESDPSMDLSEAYQGGDQFMREVMRVGNLFESWACKHVAFQQLNDVWPYLLESRFGDTCLDLMDPGGFAGFNEAHCLRVALRLRLPMWLEGCVWRPTP